MNGDETLRDALRDDAQGGAAPSDAWDQVRARAGSIRHRRKLAQRAIGGLTAAALVAGVIVGSGVLKSEDKTVIATPPSGDQIVAVQGPNNGGDHLVVLSADDGHVIRTLADDIGITFGGISVTPDGETVYFARLRPGPQCDQVEIAKVPSIGGDVEVVGSGMSPLVSPDGKTLVYVRSPEDDPCGVHSEIVRTDLATGTETVLAVDEVRNHAAAPRVPLAWSPDSTRWLTVICCFDELWSAVIVEPVGSPGQARQVDTRSPVEGATYLPDGRVLVAIPGLDEPSHEQLHELVVFEGEAGAPENDPPIATDFELQPIETIFESRENGVLRITANSSGDVLLHFGGDLLQRWHPGDAEATNIARDIKDATWLPTQQSVPSEPTTTTTAPIEPVLGPNQMVVARTLDTAAGGELLVLAADGTVVRRLGSSGQDVPWIAVTPDGKTAYYEQGTLDGCDDAGEIDAARLDIYPPGFSGGFSGSWAVLSPDGTKLAYRSGPCGGSLTVVDVNTNDRMDFTLTNERSWTLADPADGGPLPELVGPVSWDADNQHLMLRVNREPSTEFWYVDTATESAAIIGSVFKARGEQGSEIGPSSFAPLGKTGRWAAIYINVGGPSLVEYDLATDSIVGPLAEVPTSDVTIVGSDAAGQNLLLLVPNGDAFDLFRWSEGDAILTFVASDITAADW